MKIDNKYILLLSITVFCLNLLITLFTYIMARNSPGERGPRGIPGTRGLVAFG